MERLSSGFDVMNGSGEPLLRPRQVACLLNVSPSEICRLYKAGVLPYILLGTSIRKRGGKVITVEHVRFDPADVEAFKKARRVEGQR